MIKINRLFLIPLLVLLVATGCSKGETKIESEFPIPADVESIDTDDVGGVNFQTSLGLSEAVAFYREEFNSFSNLLKKYWQKINKKKKKKESK